KQQLRIPSGPRAAFHELAPRHHLARAGQNQRPGEVGGRVGEDVGSVGDLDAAYLRRDYVDVVVPDRAVGDDLELREPLQLGAAHPAGHERHDGDVVTGRRRLIRWQPGDVEARQLVGLEQPLELRGDEDAVAHYLLVCARRIESSTASARV